MPTAGVYVLVTNDEELPYPRDRCRVFYIGQADSGSRRLADHQWWAQECRDKLHSDEPFGPLGYWKYQAYAAAFGATVRWFPTSDAQAAKDLEARLIGDFFRHFGAIPIANSQQPTEPSE